MLPKNLTEQKSSEKVNAYIQCPTKLFLEKARHVE